VLFGGISGEHAISVRSAATVVRALEQSGRQAIPVGITHSGTWRLADFRSLLDRAPRELLEVPGDAGVAVAVANDGGGARLIALEGRELPEQSRSFDLVFPILHGPGGEDGSIQGLLDAAGAPYVGAGCAASAVAMDKLLMKTLCAGAGIPQVRFLAAGERTASEVGREVKATFGFPCFVKPANLGSSVGISRVAEPDGLDAALETARSWDRRVIIEEGVDAREIEIALLGGSVPKLSPLGEIVTPGGFYDFAAKYVNDDAQLIAGAKVEPAQLDAIHRIARQAWELIGCRGMARADFFIERSSGRVLLSEINTIPGFTSISMYPRLWGTAGVSLVQLVDELIDTAFDPQRSTPSRQPGKT
jgi:D-alanine-D-alanine ligase